MEGRSCSGSGRAGARGRRRESGCRRVRQRVGVCVWVCVGYWICGVVDICGGGQRRLSELLLRCGHGLAENVLGCCCCCLRRGGRCHCRVVAVLVVVIMVVIVVAFAVARRHSVGLFGKMFVVVFVECYNPRQRLRLPRPTLRHRFVSSARWQQQWLVVPPKLKRGTHRRNSSVLVCCHVSLEGKIVGVGVVMAIDIDIVGVADDAVLVGPGACCKLRTVGHALQRIQWLLLWMVLVIVRLIMLWLLFRELLLLLLLLIVYKRVCWIAASRQNFDR
mmetsp:Transcript_6515/g.18701  ORF Transcript_6515/g.18701 Transcript_6515/m.18701 type:complete len:276 (+) Transcript_6515:2965-3792(+)